MLGVVLARKAAITALGMFLLMVMPGAHAQTFAVLYNFTDGSDGAKPGAGMTMGQPGTLYGTTQYGGDLSCDLGGNTRLRCAFQVQ